LWFAVDGGRWRSNDADGLESVCDSRALTSIGVEAGGGLPMRKYICGSRRGPLCARTMLTGDGRKDPVTVGRRPDDPPLDSGLAADRRESSRPTLTPERFLWQRWVQVRDEFGARRFLFQGWRKKWSECCFTTKTPGASIGVEPGNPTDFAGVCQTRRRVELIRLQRDGGPDLSSKDGGEHGKQLMRNDCRATGWGAWGDCVCAT